MVSAPRNPQSGEILCSNPRWIHVFPHVNRTQDSAPTLVQAQPLMCRRAHTHTHTPLCGKGETRTCWGYPMNLAAHLNFWAANHQAWVFFFPFFFLFLGLHPRRMEVPRLGVESELKPPAYATATATRDLKRVCDLHHSSRQCQILYPLSEARIEPASSWILVRLVTH